MLADEKLAEDPEGGLSLFSGATIPTGLCWRGGSISTLLHPEGQIDKKDGTDTKREKKPKSAVVPGYGFMDVVAI